MQLTDANAHRRAVQPCGPSGSSSILFALVWQTGFNLALRMAVMRPSLRDLQFQLQLSCGLCTQFALPCCEAPRFARTIPCRRPSDGLTGRSVCSMSKAAYRLQGPVLEPIGSIRTRWENTHRMTMSSFPVLLATSGN